MQNREERHAPAWSYAVLTGTFTTGLGAVLLAAWRRDRLPERVPIGDVALSALAVQKASRLITRDRVTTFLRRGVATNQRSAGHGEVDEQPRGDGLQLALGELLTCPYCIGLWVATAALGGMLHAPRATRAVSIPFASLALADAAQAGYSRLINPPQGQGS
jgi:hypothetical protein